MSRALFAMMLDGRPRICGESLALNWALPDIVIRGKTRAGSNGTENSMQTGDGTQIDEIDLSGLACACASV